MLLSICVVTMNRAEQLKNALESCLKCNLPEKTEFVIIDNASSDNTEKVAKEILDDSGCPYYYEKLPENLGVGGGRNYAFGKANGGFMYMLDDDAVIAENNKDFFVKAIEIFSQNDAIITLTTQIYDTAWKRNRVSLFGKELSKNIYTCKMFCGGSHFLRRDFFGDPPYLSNKYGYEELPPSLLVRDSGKINAFCPDLLIVHKPLVDKWNFKEAKNAQLLINECAVEYAIKKMMYPVVLYPVVYLAYKMRCKKHLAEIAGYKRLTSQIIKDTVSNHSVNYRIKLATVLSLYKDFGVSVF